MSAPAAVQPQAPRALPAVSFPAAGAALQREIDRRASELKQGPVGNRAVELASLRLAASGRELIDAGSPGGALEALERAVSLWGENGYACLYLAHVYGMQGRRKRAAEFAAFAGRYLPADTEVRAELEGLDLGVDNRATVAGS